MAKTVAALLPFLVVILGHPGMGAVTAVADSSSCDVLTTAIASNQGAIQQLLQDVSGGKQQAEDFQNLEDRLALLENKVAEHHKGECPRGWTPFGGQELSCYLYDEKLSTWDESVEFCKAKGGYLAKITSDSEHDDASRVTKGDAWIGLSDKGQRKGDFKWLDGTTPIYTNWATGQPDVNALENCVFMAAASEYQWQDDACTATHGRLCEMPSRPY